MFACMHCVDATIAMEYHEIHDDRESWTQSDPPDLESLLQSTETLSALKRPADAAAEYAAFECLGECVFDEVSQKK